MNTLVVYRKRDGVVSRDVTCHFVAAEENRVFPNVHQRSNAPFGKAVVYGVV